VAHAGGDRDNARKNAHNSLVSPRTLYRRSARTLGRNKQKAGNPPLAARLLGLPTHSDNPGIQMDKRAVKMLVVMGLAASSCGLAPGFVAPCQAQQPIVHTVMGGNASANASAWEGMGIRLKRGLSVVTDAASITVFGVGMDNALMSINSADNGKTWGILLRHGTGLASAPACAQDLTTKNEGIRCFYARNGVLWNELYKQDGSEGTASVVGDKKLVSEPSVVISDVQAASGKKTIKLNYRVFVHDADDNGLWYADTFLGQIAGKWQAMDGKLKGGPSCLRSEGASTCYVVGADDAVWTVRYDHDHFAWKRVGGRAVGGVHAWNVGSATQLAVRGTDSMLWVGRQDADSAEWQWTNHPGEIASVPACSRMRCFAILSNGELGFLDLSGRL